MTRLLFVLLAVLVAVVLNPTLRKRVEPHLAFALDPLYEWQVKDRVAEMARGLQSDLAAGRPLPTEREFEAYLTGRYPGDDAHLDPWGTPYYLKRVRNVVQIGSAGPDRERGSEDDVLSPRVSGQR